MAKNIYFYLRLQEREMRSFRESDSSDHVTYSYQLRDVLPAHKIEALSQGCFCGYVADTFKQRVNPKVFCGEVQLGHPTIHNEDIPQIVHLPENCTIEDEIEKNYLRIKIEIANLIQIELNKPAEGVRTDIPSSSSVLVFEGFFDFLSWQVLQSSLCPSCDVVVLNSVSNLNRASDYLRLHDKIVCFLDNDTAGKKTFSSIKMMLPDKQIADMSHLYQKHKDLSEMLQESRGFTTGIKLGL